MVYVRDFVPIDASIIEPQPAQAEELAQLAQQHRLALQHTPAWSLWHQDKVLAIVGLMPMWPGRQMAWAFLARNIGTAMTSVTRECRRLIERHGERRVELSVDCGFEQAHRWARLLGFHLEAERLRCYSVTGADQALYARIK